MSDPHRLLSTLGDADDLERDLLSSIERADPPEGAKAEAWARLSAQIAAVALVGSASHAAAASTSVAAAEGAHASFGAKAAIPALLKLFGAKAVIGLALGGTAVGGTALWLHTRSQRVTVSAAALPAPAAPASLAPAGAAVPTSAPEPASTAVSVSDLAPAVSPDTAVKPNAEQRRRDQLSAESALLTQARADLRKGDARGAQQLLNRLQAQFPNGVLGQEREVLAIEVLAARGNAAAAQKRAQAFIAAYPESPHSAQLSRYTE